MSLFKIRRDFKGGRSEWLFSYQVWNHRYAWVDFEIDAFAFTEPEHAKEVVDGIKRSNLNEDVIHHFVVQCQ